MNNALNTYNIFTFNHLKHHLYHTAKYCISKKDSFSSKKELKTVENDLKLIGDNITDIYTGLLPDCKIYDNITTKLKKSYSVEYNSFQKHFIHKDYFKIDISDGSSWIIRLGKNVESYIHIHPSRVGINTIRFTANTWKTAIICFLYKLNNQNFSFDISTTNMLRTNYLELPPVKNLKDNGKIKEAYNLLESKAGSILI